jgi:alpha-glucosidase
MWAECRIVSPDGTLAISVSDTGGLYYRVDVDGESVVARSRLGLVFGGDVRFGPGAVLERCETSNHAGTWTNRFGKRRTVVDRWNQMHITLRQPGTEARRFGLTVRAYDDGVAFRYTLDRNSGFREFVVERELTEFVFAADHRCWAGEPSDCAENLYVKTRLSRIPVVETTEEGSAQPYLSVLPLLVETPAAYVAVAEADLLDWAGMFLTGTGLNKVTVALASRADGRGRVVSRPPRESPWRVLMIGRRPGDLVSSDLIANLSTPCQMDDPSWIRPGICAWDAWWTGLNPHLPEYTGVWSRGDTTSHMEYIDFAAEMGWSYQLVDWFWYRNMSSYEVHLNHGPPAPNKPPIDFRKSESHIGMPALLAHARKRGIRLLIWLHSDDLNTFGIDQAFDLMASWGAAGVKIDFMNSDSQETVVWYERVLRAAARHKLLVDFHGAYKPTGLARTWPNYITQEGVLGNEYNKLDTRCTPRHTVNLPFTRGLLGPMDFTPGGFLNRPPTNWKKTAPTEVMGTRTRQLAMAVVYESPLLVLCDSPSNYRNQRGIEFYRGLPTVWDETVVPSAEVDRHIVVARRSGKRWWLAAMNGDEAVELRVPLDFLDPEPWFKHSFSDTVKSAEKPELVHETTSVVESGQTLRLKLAPAGGYATILTPLKERSRE